MTESVESGRFLPEMMISVPERQRRWTVLIRFLLLIPHFIVLALLGLAAWVVAFIGWWAALFMGRLPEWAAEFLALYVAYSARVNASLMLLIDTYPSFVLESADEAVRTEFQPGRLNRWAVLFRFILIIPAGIIASVVMTGWSVVAFFFWLTVLVLGRTPRPVFDASAAALRYNFRTSSYMMMLTGSYPKKLFGDERAEQNPPQVSSGTRPLVMSTGGKVLLIVLIVLGIPGMFASSFAPATQPQDECGPGQYDYGYGCVYAEAVGVLPPATQ